MPLLYFYQLYKVFKKFYHIGTQAIVKVLQHCVLELALGASYVFNYYNYVTCYTRLLFGRSRHNLCIATTLFTRISGNICEN